MPLAPGTRLGPYEILAPLGTGGMGEVYRARDTRLGRTVAIKVLAPGASRSGELAQRLENEARTISQLSHPNICTLHDIGHQDGMNYLVLEMVSGKTLREVLRGGKLSVREMVPIAVQVAEGLAKAHESGIIHRDLKPENVMVSAESVKILDFGLAKLSEGGAEARGGNTTVGLQTQPDVVLGTIAYMSPEQAKGSGLDFRSDQFSFGVMLYEMATGRRPFEGKTQAQTLLGIMQDEPEAISALNPEVPPPFFVGWWSGAWRRSRRSRYSRRAIWRGIWVRYGTGCRICKPGEPRRGPATCRCRVRRLLGGSRRWRRSAKCCCGEMYGW